MDEGIGESQPKETLAFHCDHATSVRFRALHCFFAGGFVRDVGVAVGSQAPAVQRHGADL